MVWVSMGLVCFPFKSLSPQYIWLPGFDLNLGQGAELYTSTTLSRASLVAKMVKNPPEMQETLGSIPRSGRSPGEENDNLLQYSCLENPMDIWSWWAIVHRVSKSQRWLSAHTHTHTHTQTQTQWPLPKTPATFNIGDSHGAGRRSCIWLT